MPQNASPIELTVNGTITNLYRSTKDGQPSPNVYGMVNFGDNRMNVIFRNMPQTLQDKLSALPAGLVYQLTLHLSFIYFSGKDGNRGNQSIYCEKIAVKMSDGAMASAVARAKELLSV